MYFALVGIGASFLQWFGESVGKPGVALLTLLGCSPFAYFGWIKWIWPRLTNDYIPNKNERILIRTLSNLHKQGVRRDDNDEIIPLPAVPSPLLEIATPNCGSAHIDALHALTARGFLESEIGTWSPDLPISKLHLTRDDGKDVCVWIDESDEHFPVMQTQVSGQPTYSDEHRWTGFVQLYRLTHKGYALLDAFA